MAERRGIFVDPGSMTDRIQFTVEKGTLVYSTRPGWPAEGRPAQRTYKVWVSHRSGPRIVWAGAGGYWTWVIDKALEGR